MVGEPLRERLRSLDRRELVGLAAIAVLIVAGIVLWYVRSLPSPVKVEAVEQEAVAEVQPTPDPSPAPVVVYVTGWVRRPGVYELTDGARVVDAIQMAGGPKKGAALQSVNLAALLIDAQQIHVPKQGGPRAPVAGAPGTGVAAAPTGGGAVPPGAGGQGLINVNTATLEQLETLPGIGPTLAQRIIDHRTEHGPFGTIDDLLDVSGIGEARLADIRSKVTV